MTGSIRSRIVAFVIAAAAALAALFVAPCAQAAQETIFGNPISLSNWSAGPTGWGGIRVDLRTGTYVTTVRIYPTGTITADQISQCTNMVLAALTAAPSNQWGLPLKFNISGNVTTSLLSGMPEDGHIQQRTVYMDALSACQVT